MIGLYVKLQVQKAQMEAYLVCCNADEFSLQIALSRIKIQKQVLEILDPFYHL